MVYCQAWDCQNRPDDNNGRHFFQFPKPAKEPQRLQRWPHNCATSHTLETFKWNLNKKVCSDHFHPSCILEDKIAKLFGTPPAKPQLVPGTVPTIFKRMTYDLINLDGTTAPPRPSIASLKRANIADHREVSNQ